MPDDPQSRLEEGRALDPDDITVAPDRRPMDEQPPWRQDFPIDWPRDQYVARRDFARFLGLTSGAFVVGHGWIAAQHLARPDAPPARVKVASLADVPVGSSTTFRYPTDHDPCVLVRPDASTLVAFSQACTHLSCAVVPKVSEGLFECPCHEGYFDLRTGRNMAGPPPRPLPKIALEVEGDDVYAVGVEERSV